MIEAEIKGIDELNKRLDAISVDLRKKGGRFALRKAADIVRNAAIANAARLDDSQTPENISKNIATRWNTRLNKRTGDLGFRVGVLGGAVKPEGKLASLGEISGKGKANPGGDTWYWRFLEFGTKKMAARPFMLPALQQNIDNAINAFITHYNAALDRAIQRGEK